MGWRESTSITGVLPTLVSSPRNTWPGWDYDAREANWDRLLDDRRRFRSSLRARTAGSSVSSPADRSGPMTPPTLANSTRSTPTSPPTAGTGPAAGRRTRRVVDLSGVAIDAALGLAENPSRGFYQALGGVQIRQQTITVGGADLLEIANGWSDISPLTLTRDASVPRISDRTRRRRRAPLAPPVPTTGATLRNAGWTRAGPIQPEAVSMAYRLRSVQPDPSWAESNLGSPC